LVEPRLCNSSGHEFEHALVFARAIKKSDPTCRVVVLAGKVDEHLTAILAQEKAIDACESCFPARWVFDDAPARQLIRAAASDALRVRRTVRRYRTSTKPILFFDSLDPYRVLLLGFLRIFAPFAAFPAVAVVRYDPLHLDGTVRRRYAQLWLTRVGRCISHFSTKNTLLYTDSEVLQTVLRERFGITVNLSPIPTPGVWSRGTESVGVVGRPARVAFVGQPRTARAFPLFVATAVACERERLDGKISFVVTTPVGSLEQWQMAQWRPLLESKIAGLQFAERRMDSSQFAEEMAKSDIIWALGDPPDFYRRQTSGIFTHALSLGRRVITDRGGWAQAAAGLVPICRYIDPTLAQAQEAIRALATTASDESSRDFVARWRERHSEHAFDQFVAEALRRAAWIPSQA
jgi:hypothetical protein